MHKNDKNVNLLDFIKSKESGILENLNSEVDLKGAGTLIELNLENESENFHYWLANRL